jgi:hypothetical protein
VRLRDWPSRLAEGIAMSDAPRILYSEHPVISPEQVREARTRAWAFIFQCYQDSQKAAEPASEPAAGDADAIVTNKKEVKV